MEFPVIIGYEYKIEYFNPNEDIGTIEDELNKWGAEGWELRGQSQNARGSIIYTFTRQKTWPNK
jgi:hypothetical protein